ncbi:MAG: hypothetical protein ACYTBS_09585 [Planctomycetota bacterium]
MEETQDALPHFDKRLRDQIESRLRDLLGEDFRVSAKDWGTLRRILVKFQTEYTDWHGFLRMGKIRKVQAARAAAEKLLEKIESLDESELRWVIDLELSPEGTEVFIDQLGTLARWDGKSIYADDVKSKKAGWAGHEEKMRGRLQLRLDAWWRNITGKEPEVEEGTQTPFSRFLEQVFSALPPEIDLGHKRTAVEKRRRDLTKDEKNMEKIRKELAEPMRRLKVEVGQI